MATIGRRGFVYRSIGLDAELEDAILTLCDERKEMWAPIVRGLLRQALADQLGDAAPTPDDEREPALSGAVA